jgi:hypothetical protein
VTRAKEYRVKAVECERLADDAYGKSRNEVRSILVAIAINGTGYLSIAFASAQPLSAIHLDHGG